jgi:hypothetical protein
MYHRGMANCSNKKDPDRRDQLERQKQMAKHMEHQFLPTTFPTVHRVILEPKKGALYVSNVDHRITEEFMKQLFETTGIVQNIWISIRGKASLYQTHH